MYFIVKKKEQMHKQSLVFKVESEFVETFLTRLDMIQAEYWLPMACDIPEEDVYIKNETDLTDFYAWAGAPKEA